MVRLGRPAIRANSSRDVKPLCWVCEKPIAGTEVVTGSLDGDELSYCEPCFNLAFPGVLTLMRCSCPICSEGLSCN